MTKRSIASLVSALICLALLNGCSSNKQKPQEITEPTEESVRLKSLPSPTFLLQSKRIGQLRYLHSRFPAARFTAKQPGLKLARKHPVQTLRMRKRSSKIISLRGKSKNAQSAHKPEPFIPFLTPAS